MIKKKYTKTIASVAVTNPTVMKQSKQTTTNYSYLPEYYGFLNGRQTIVNEGKREMKRKESGGGRKGRIYESKLLPTGLVVWLE